MGALVAPDVAGVVVVAMHADCVWLSIERPPLGNILGPEKPSRPPDRIISSTTKQDFVCVCVGFLRIAIFVVRITENTDFVQDPVVFSSGDTSIRAIFWRHFLGG